MTSRVEMNEREMEDIDEMVERFNADLLDDEDEMTAEEMVIILGEAFLKAR